MKRILFFVALVLGVVSCQSDLDDFGANVGGEQEVIVNVSLPEETRANSAEGGISNVIASDEYTVRYIFQVYNADGTQSKTPVKQYSDNKSVSFPVRLVPNRNYRFVVWADIVKESDKADLHYNTTNFPEISLNGTWVAMDETRDAYTVSELVTEFNSAKSISLTLKRPLAKLRVITTDMEELLGLTPKTATVSYVTEHYNTFDALQSVVGDSKVGGCEHKNYAIKEYETTNGKVLFTDYFFAKDDIVKFNISVAMSDGKSVDRSFTTDIPVKRNHLTTLIGDILTDGNNITVNVTEGFENGTEWNPGDDKYDVEIWDGKSTKAPAYDDATKTYTIKLPSELAWLADQVNGVTRAAANDFSGKTFELTQDIDLGFNEWTPIGNNTNKFQGTFDGKGHKIANLLITGNNNYVGLFGFTAGGEIKDFVVENAKVSGRLGVGVIAGSPYTSKFNDITIQGHVEVNGKFYVGGVAGYSAYANWNNITVNVDETSYVDANSVENDVAYRTYVGGVCGFNGEGGHSFTNITSNIDVKGSTIDAGGLFGIAHYGNKFENCSCSGDVEIYAAEEAEEAQEIGGIAGVWNNGGEDVVFTNCTFTGTLKTNIAVDFYYDGLIGKPYSANGTGKLIIDGYEMVANGVGMKDGEYFVMSAQGLAWVEAQEDTYFAGKTIKLANDIDMTGVTIEKPIHFWNGRTTFDGQDYTISNLTMTTTSTAKKPFGLFGGTADIKNVKFDNANISGYSYVAVVAGNLYGNIENCHVSNSSVTCTYWMAGAMSGQYNAGNVTNCSVTNTTITGPAAVGALVGNINESAGERKVENCTVTDCTVAQNGSFGGDYDKMFGTAVGLVNISNSKVYINGCKVENTTVKGATSANIFGLNGGDNTTIYVDGYTYGSDGTIKDEVTGNLIANSPETLEAALTTAGAAGAGDTTIVFEENATLNMTNAEWTPIYVNGYNGADIVTIEGNGATLKGLTAPLFKGGFAGGSGIIIKNLTITESNIVSDNTDGSGAFIECVDSMETITLDNCHFTNSTISGSRTGGLIGWTSGYSNENDGPVKTYVTIKNCSVIDVDINATGSAAAINGHAGASDWTYTTIENCTVKDCNINSTDDGGWRTGVVVGTANVGEVTINNITESGNTLTQTGKTAPEGYLRNYYGRFVPGTTGKLTIDGYEVVAEGKLKDTEGNTIATNVAGLKDALKEGEDVILADDMAIKSSESESNSYGKTGINMTNGGTIDGGGNDISINAWSTWDCAINTTGGTIKNINVTGGMRGIFVNHNSDNCSKVYLENVVIDGTVYTISCDQGTNKGLEAINSTFNGWTSYAATIGDVKFTNCNFGEGQGYAYCRPYAPTEFVGCEFEAGFTLEPCAAVTFENCTLNGVALTDANIGELVTDTANVTIK